MTASRAVGIDLGTTHCAVARLDDSGRTAMARNPQGDLLIPSTIFFEADELLFGRSANQAADSAPDRTAEIVKRDLGQAYYSRAVGGQLLSAELIEACLLKDLCTDLPPLLGGRPPAVALAVPASFNQVQRRAMVDAARIAGLDLLGTITDPLAAGLAFSESQGYLSADAAGRPGVRVLVFDLGGGKLDVAILEIKAGRIRTLGIGGDSRLGGRDWDMKLADYLAAQFTKQFGDDPRYDMKSVRRLLASAEEAKHTLTARQQAKVRIERIGDATEVVVARHVFDEISEDLLERARRATDETLARAGMAWRDLAHVLLVGGATRMPMISTMLESLTGLKPANLHADEAVARGAALYAEQLLAAREGRKGAQPLEFVQMTAHGLGIEWSDASGTARAENVALVPRGAELPCGTASKLATQSANQTLIETDLLEGESRDPDQCAHIARLKISNLPPELAKGSIIELNYQLAPDGKLSVNARTQKGAVPLAVSMVAERNLSEQEVADWKKLVEVSPGLRLLLQQAAKHGTFRAAREAAFARSAAAPAAVQAAKAESAEEPAGEFQLNVAGKSAGDRARKSRNRSRNLLIMFGGHIVFAALGLAIGYYILMYLRPEWNVWRLPLPGLRVEGPAYDSAVGDVP